MAGCAASPEPTSLAVYRELTGKLLQKCVINRFFVTCSNTGAGFLS